MTDSALQYVSRFNEIEVSGKINFVAAITSYVHHTTEFTAAQAKLFEHSLPFLKSFGSYLNKVRKVTSLSFAPLPIPLIEQEYHRDTPSQADIEASGEEGLQEHQSCKSRGLLLSI